MSKFTENAFSALMKAKNEGQVKRTFDKSCEICASKNLMSCPCDRCPIAGAVEIKLKNMKLLDELLNRN